nr:ATP-dependent 6-phosphofructokinase [Cellulomonas sp. IC4_254]
MVTPREGAAATPPREGDPSVRVGLLTGGGDVPGLNAAIRAVVKRGEGEYGHSIIGFRNGWRGVVDGDIVPLSRNHIRNVLPVGGTLLGTARFHPHASDGGLDAVLATLEAERIEALICIGGDGTLHAASKVAEAGVKIVAIPKTIDNDVWGTDRSIGFDTAVEIATEAIDRVHTTAESHNRVMIVEVMGRSAGWIAVTAGIAGGAEVVLAPEEPFDIDKVIKFLKHRHRAHANFSIVVVAEGAVPAEGTSMSYEAPVGQFGEIVAGAITARVKAEIEQRTGFDTRVTVLGHVQRGGSPVPADRILGSRFGVAAIDAISQGRTDVMTALRGDEVVLVPLQEIAGKVKRVPTELLQVVRALA